MPAPLPANEAQRLTALHEHRILDTAPEDAFDDITRLAAQVCGVPVSAVTLVDQERQWFKSVFGFPDSEMPRDMAFCSYTILQRDVMVVPDATQDERFRHNPLVTGNPNVRFYAGVPLVTSDGFALGSLCVFDRTARHLSAEQETALRLLAGQVTGRLELQRRVALQETLMAERARLQRETERLLAEAQERADRDPLTGLSNHRVFHAKLEEEAERCRREGTTLAVVVLDLDNFKFFNDAHGHATGDAVLRLVAQRLAQVCRPYDTIARFGGDEFALLLPNVGDTEAGGIEARLRADLHGLCLEVAEQGPIPLGVSLGAALYPHEDWDRHEALRQADARLYRAKNAQEALRILEAGAGTQWDPQCVTAFLKAQEDHALAALTERATDGLNRAA